VQATEEYLTIEELSARLKIKPKTVKNKMASGILRKGVHYFSPKGRLKEGLKTTNAQVNVPCILAGMKAKGWGVAVTCVNVGVNNKTLAKILDGKVPRRLDAFYRVIDGLKIPIQEALIAPTHKAAQGSRLYELPDRRRADQIA
jgi:hypothetical protein